MRFRSPKLPSAVAVAALVFAAAISTPTLAQMKEQTVTVGGAPMYPSKNIIQNAANSKDHTTLVAAVKAAGLVETLQGPGPFTVFAPVNKAFDKLPQGTVPTLLEAENKDKLVAVLTYHVVPGRLSAKDLWNAATKAGGKAKIKTVEGDELTVEFKSQTLTLRDAKGNVSRVTNSERVPVERRHSRRRHGVAAELMSPPRVDRRSHPPPTGPPLRRSIQARRARAAGLSSDIAARIRRCHRPPLFPIDGGAPNHVLVCGRAGGALLLQRFARGPVVPGHLHQTGRNCVIGGDQGQAQADIGLAVEIHGIRHARIPPHFVTNAEPGVRFPTFCIFFDECVIARQPKAIPLTRLLITRLCPSPARTRVAPPPAARSNAGKPSGAL